MYMEPVSGTLFLYGGLRGTKDSISAYQRCDDIFDFFVEGDSGLWKFDISGWSCLLTCFINDADASFTRPSPASVFGHALTASLDDPNTLRLFGGMRYLGQYNFGKDFCLPQKVPAIIIVGCLNQLWQWSIKLKKWTFISPYGSPGQIESRAAFGSFQTNGTFFVFSGTSDGFGNAGNELWTWGAPRATLPRPPPLVQQFRAPFTVTTGNATMNVTVSRTINSTTGTSITTTLVATSNEVSTETSSTTTVVATSNEGSGMGIEWYDPVGQQTGGGPTSTNSVDSTLQQYSTITNESTTTLTTSYDPTLTSTMFLIPLTTPEPTIESEGSDIYEEHTTDNTVGAEETEVVSYSGMVEATSDPTVISTSLPEIPTNSNWGGLLGFRDLVLTGIICAVVVVMVSVVAVLVCRRNRKARRQKSTEYAVYASSSISNLTRKVVDPWSRNDLTTKVGVAEDGTNTQSRRSLRSEFTTRSSTKITIFSNISRTEVPLQKGTRL